MKSIRYAAFLLAVISFFSCAKPKDLVYQDVKGFTVKAIGVKETTIGFSLQYYNPNNFTLDLKGGALDIYINEKYLGKANIDSRFTIPRQDTFLIPVSFTANLMGLLKSSFQALLNPEVNVRIQGSIKVGRKGIFLNIPVNYSFKQKIEL